MGLLDGVRHSAKRAALCDVFDWPKTTRYQVEARKYLRDGETYTWTFKSWCRGTEGSYTATRIGDTVSVTREEREV